MSLLKSINPWMLVEFVEIIRKPLFKQVNFYY